MRALVLVVALVLTGCACDRAAPGASSEPGAEVRPEAVGRVGTVEGLVRLAPGATLPAYSLSEVGRVGERAVTPEGCPPPQADDLTPVRLGSSGGLTSVMVTATGDPDAFFAALPSERPPRDRGVSIERCRLTPRLISATKGDTLVVTNRSSYPFLPSFGGSVFMQALPEGEGRREELTRGGIFPLACGFAAPCGRAEVVVVYHPVHTVSDETGRFRLEGVPADQEVEIHAWHPLFEEAVARVRVGVGETKTVELTIRPAARADGSGTGSGTGSGSGSGTGSGSGSGSTAPEPATPVVD